MSATRKSGPYARWLALALVSSLTACGDNNNNDTTTPRMSRHSTISLTQRPGLTPIDVTRVDLGTAVNSNGTISNPLALFKSTDTIYVAVTTARPGHDIKLKAKWTYQDDSVVKEITKTVNPTDTLVTDFQISSDTGWPRGRYKVQIFVSGQMAAVTEYTVTQ